MGIASIVLSSLALALVLPTLVRIRSPAAMPLLLPSFLGTAWSPYLAALGVVAVALGAAGGSPVGITMGAVAALVAGDHAWRVTRRHDAAFVRALGAPGTGGCRWRPGIPRTTGARQTRDVAFATIPGRARPLVCDVWEPPLGVARSGLAVVYLHGSAWYLIDKDIGTRAFFSHLAGKGHVIVDVAYRLGSETDMAGMQADAKRAVAWVKAHAADYGVRPDRVVLMGGSAGGHLALLAAYTAGHPDLTPADLRGEDTSVAGVVSYYGVGDLRAYDAQARRYAPKDEAALQPTGTGWVKSIFDLVAGRELPAELFPPLPSHARMMRALAGGLPEEIGERFDLVSPIHHVSKTSPPTLHFQPAHDTIVPVESGRALAKALEAANVPVVYVELARTHHAFDLVAPSLASPAAQAALDDTERFLGLLATR